jgi:geranylgeranyl diphosphate synthase type II
MFELNTYLNDRRRLVENALDMHLPDAETRPAKLHEAMRYSLFAGGKRIRPILCIAAAEACGGTAEDVIMPAIALEALHTFTLVHDDLPAMDDDALRRGKPSTHIAYGEANAILTGDALIAQAFEWLGGCTAPPPHLPTQFVLELAEAAGSRGVIGGQVEDIAAEDLPPSADLLDFIHLHKTAALIRAAVRMGAIGAGASAQVLDALSLYGCNIGIAFQIADDILDATASTETIGKPAGSDAEKNKLTYVALYGIEESRRRAATLLDEALQALQQVPGDREPLEAIARLVVERTN